jgi:hypothetical protein
MDIPYNLLGGVHLLTGIISNTTTYAANHGGVAFVRPTRLPLYDATTPDDATKVMRVKAEWLIKLASTTIPVSRQQCVGSPSSYKRLSVTSGSTA